MVKYNLCVISSGCAEVGIVAFVHRLDMLEYLIIQRKMFLEVTCCKVRGLRLFVHCSLLCALARAIDDIVLRVVMRGHGTVKMHGSGLCNPVLLCAINNQQHTRRLIIGHTYRTHLVFWELLKHSCRVHSSFLSLNSSGLLREI